VTCNDLLYWW